MKIKAIILNGRHGGAIVFNTEYSPTIKLPVQSTSQISIGEAHDGSVRIGDEIEYQECFRSVDNRCVIYSESGHSYDINYIIHLFKQTYPIKLY